MVVVVGWGWGDGVSLLESKEMEAGMEALLSASHCFTAHPKLQLGIIISLPWAAWAMATW